MFRKSLALLLMTCAFAGAATAGPKDKCTCKHLDEVRRILADTELLRDLYAGKAKALEAEETKIIRQNPTRAADSDEMKALNDKFNTWAETEAPGAVARRSGPASAGAPSSGASATHFDQEKCEPNEAELKRMRDGQKCKQLADLLNRHENFHHDVCVKRRHYAAGTQTTEARRTSEEIGPEMVSRYVTYGTPSSIAYEEAAAYAGDAAVLKALIDDLTKNREYLLRFNSLARLDWKMNLGPAGTAAEYASSSFIPLEVEDGPASQRVKGSAPWTYEGRLIGSPCKYTGMPLHLTMTVDGTLADGKFKLTFNKGGIKNTPFGVRCPGGGSGMGSVVAGPVVAPHEVVIEAADGAKLVFPYASQPDFSQLSQIAKLSGDATLKIETACGAE